MCARRVLAFDIGIKNLAYCITENSKNVVDLQNCNILEPVEVEHCFMCKAKASYSVGSNVFCKRHIPGTHSPLKDLEGKYIIKLPPIKDLKEIAKRNKCTVNGTTRDKYIEALCTKFALPYIQKKQANASKISLELIHDALRKFVQEKWSLFSGCTHVLLENQPVFKNPHMKSVQVLLFATLREKYLSNSQHPEFHLVHAKKKVMDAESGDEGYAERKQKSEDRLRQLFESKQVINTELYETWKKAKKRSDMADALCMCVDFTK